MFPDFVVVVLMIEQYYWENHVK